MFGAMVNRAVAPHANPIALARMLQFGCTRRTQGELIVPIHTISGRIAGLASLAASLVIVMGCEVEQTEEGRLPDVDIDAQPGQLPRFEQTREAELPDVDIDVSRGNLPEFDVDAPDIDIGTREERIEVPTGIDVETEERTITVPDVDIDRADDPNR
jgi:hypothetical protein